MFFVMIYKNGREDEPMPMTRDGELATYETLEEAEEVAKNNTSVQAWGAEIFEMGRGEPVL